MNESTVIELFDVSSVLQANKWCALTNKQNHVCTTGREKGNEVSPKLRRRRIKLSIHMIRIVTLLDTP